MVMQLVRETKKKQKEMIWGATRCTEMKWRDMKEQICVTHCVFCHEEEKRVFRFDISLKRRCNRAREWHKSIVPHRKTTSQTKTKQKEKQGSPRKSEKLSQRVTEWKSSILPPYHPPFIQPWSWQKFSSFLDPPPLLYSFSSGLAPFFSFGLAPFFSSLTTFLFVAAYIDSRESASQAGPGRMWTGSIQRDCKWTKVRSKTTLDRTWQISRRKRALF